MMELATKTRTALSRIGSHSDITWTMDASGWRERLCCLQ
jgi:hypothetical protein